MPLTVTSIMAWGAVTASVLTSVAFIIALVIAWMAKDQSNLSLLVGAVVANFTTAVGYWLGSSAGSRAKDEVPPKPPSP